MGARGGRGWESWLGQVRVGLAAPEGEGCLAVAAITQRDGQFPFSYLIYCMLWRGEAHSLNFKGGRVRLQLW